MKRWLMRLLRVGSRKRGWEARNAARAADASHAQAEVDLATAIESRDEAFEVAAELRAHNVANRYADWLVGIVRR